MSWFKGRGDDEQGGATALATEEVEEVPEGEMPIQVGRLSHETQIITIPIGGTVKDALQRAGIHPKNETIRLRGEVVDDEHVLNPHDLLILSENIRGG